MSSESKGTGKGTEEEEVSSMKSIIQDEKRCYFTGYEGPGLHKHHCVHGTANRKLADEDGLWVWLRWDFHIADSPHRTPHNDAEIDLMLKRTAQKKYEETHSHEEWMERYGRNYL